MAEVQIQRFCVIPPWRVLPLLHMWSSDAPSCSTPTDCRLGCNPGWDLCRSTCRCYPAGKEKIWLELAVRRWLTPAAPQPPELKQSRVKQDVQKTTAKTSGSGQTAQPQPRGTAPRTGETSPWGPPVVKHGYTFLCFDNSKKINLEPTLRDCSNCVDVQVGEFYCKKVCCPHSRYSEMRRKD